MSRRVAAAAVLAVAAVSLAALVSAPGAQEDASDGKTVRVVVVNQPRTYTVQGEVSVAGPIRQGSMVVLRDIVVPPVSPAETTRLVDAGTINTDGFTSVVVGVAGQIKDQFVRAGKVGAFLVPVDELMERALDESGQLLFAVEVKASTGGGTPAYFASDQARATVAFPRYRVLLYNSSDKAASVNVYAYLAN